MIDCNEDVRRRREYVSVRKGSVRKGSLKGKVVRPTPVPVTSELASIIQTSFPSPSIVEFDIFTSESDYSLSKIQYSGNEIASSVDQASRRNSLNRWTTVAKVVQSSSTNNFRTLLHARWYTRIIISSLPSYLP